MGEEIRGFLSVLMILVLFAGVLFLAYYTTKLMGKKISLNSSSGGQIKVLDRLSLGQDKMLLIVQAAEKTLLVAVASHAVATLCELDPEALEQLPAAEDSPFMGVLKDMLKNRGAKGPEQRKETDE
ncbi:MAG: flagellar biosynthetic protein FliO [Provencibacterium sp.]|nr:flagellar biosynthetic protein FliO [Provencibacterium sp.]